MNSFVLVNSFISKVPALFQMYKKKSASGLSFESFLFEILGYGLNVGYSFHYNYPASSYGENIIKANFMLTGIVLGYIYKGFSALDLSKAIAAIILMTIGYGWNLFPEQLYFYNQVILIFVSNF